jgi:NAD+ kinase
MRIAIYGRAFNDNFIPFIQEFFDTLDRPEIELLIFEPFYSFLTPRIELKKEYPLFERQDDISQNIDFLFSIGGDGTLLDTITFIKDSNIPILGINTGRLGFLSNVSREELAKAIDDFLEQKYTLDKRTLLQLQNSGDLFEKHNYALNELTVHKKDSSSMITIHTYINDDYLNSYWADGLIIATPTGSTAYSLSCGGPILVPGSENFIITPIAPHNLNVRPVVVPNNNTIKLTIEGRGNQFLAALDSRSETIDSSIELTIEKANFDINLIRFDNQNFLNTIRNKLMWGLDRRN